MQVAVGTNKDYENIVLMKMLQAEERRKLIEQMQREDDGTAWQRENN